VVVSDLIALYEHGRANNSIGVLFTTAEAISKVLTPVFAPRAVGGEVTV
jgi:hypothetical protein